jgi:uncharacterized protein YyaL (SSP411 family)
MEEKTYSSPAVIELIKKHYVAIKVDQAERPDLASRYEDYGWPATVILDPDGTDIWKEAGFIEPEVFAATLKKTFENPGARVELAEIKQRSSSVDGLLSEPVRQELVARHYKSLDTTLGGTKGSHRYLRSDVVEYASVRAAEGSQTDKEWLLKTLTASMKLLDPVWGGMYQYSTNGDWEHPHFEKIMLYQSSAIRRFTDAYAILGDESFLKAAGAVRKYVKDFLTGPDGTFYASQDADLVKGEHSGDYFKLADAERRAKGIPEVQKRIFARENAWMIEALADFYAVTGDETALSDALHAAKRIQATRGLAVGGFSHSENDSGGPFLADNVAMLRAFLALYKTTGEKTWLESAASTGEFIIGNFIEGELDKAIGVLSAKKSTGPHAVANYSTDGNVDTARAANMLFHYTGAEDFKKLSQVALRHLSDSKVAFDYSTQPAILLADEEARTEPLHVTIVAHKDDAAGKALFQGALKIYSSYKRLEWWDKREGVLPHLDVQYPDLPRAAAFVCSSQRCSLPVFDPQRLAVTIKNFSTKPNGS